MTASQNIIPYFGITIYTEIFFFKNAAYEHTQFSQGEVLCRQHNSISHPAAPILLLSRQQKVQVQKYTWHLRSTQRGINSNTSHCVNIPYGNDIYFYEMSNMYQCRMQTLRINLPWRKVSSSHSPHSSHLSHASHASHGALI